MEESGAVVCACNPRAKGADPYIYLELVCD